MSGQAPEGKNATKDEVLALITEKEKLEEELSTWAGVLESQGVGMEDPLVDPDGYPRNDIDVHQVRTARNRIICLQNDLKAKLLDIEKGLHSLHAQAREGIGAAVSEGKLENGKETTMGKLPASFARVDSVDVGSPAELAGLRAGDELIAFGSVQTNNFHGKMKAISDVTKNSVNQNVRVQVLRDGRVLTLTLRPKSWSGRGFLGCHIKPIEEVVDR